jgi:hypothetical protein
MACQGLLIDAVMSMPVTTNHSIMPVGQRRNVHKMSTANESLGVTEGRACNPFPRTSFAVSYDDVL